MLGYSKFNHVLDSSNDTYYIIIVSLLYINAHVENRSYANVRGTFRCYQVKINILGLWEDGQVPYRTLYFYFYFSYPSNTHAHTHRFVARALHQSKVDLTWDEVDPKRLKTTMRRYTTSNIVLGEACIETGTQL